MLFPKLKKIVLLVGNKGCSNDEIKDELEKWKKEIIIEECYVNILEFDMFSKEFKLNIRSQNIKTKMIAFDMTLGNKISSAIFYKLSVEEGIKIINWIELQNESGVRLPWSIKLQKIKEPIQKNSKLRKMVNRAISNYSFKDVAVLYSMINDEEKSVFYEFMGEYLSFKTIFINNEYVNFFEELENSIEKIKKIIKNTNNQCKDFLLALIAILELEGEIKEIALSNIFDMFRIEMLLENIDDNYKIISSFQSNVDIDERKINRMVKELDGINKLNKNKDEYVAIFENMGIVTTEIFGDTGIKIKDKLYFDLIYIYIEFFSINNLKEHLEENFKFEKGILRIEKHDIIIDLNKTKNKKIKKIVKCNWEPKGWKIINKDPNPKIVNLILNEKGLNYEEIFKLFEESKGGCIDKKSSCFKVFKLRLRAYIREFNIEMRTEIKKIKIENIYEVDLIEETKFGFRLNEEL